MQLSIPFLKCELRNAIVALCNNLVIMCVVLGEKEL